jgi:glycosyltransferase involved in cell wall biosynthesis
MRTLCVVDNALESFAGHHFEYVRCLYECAAKRNEPILILGHRRADAKLRQYFPFEAVFRRSHYDFPTTIPILRYPVNPTVQNYVFFRDLQRSLAKRCTPDWIVFAPTMNHNHILGWAAWLQTYAPQKCPTTVLFVRNTYCESADPNRYDFRAAYAWLGFKWLEQLAGAGRPVHLVSDSARLVEEFARLTRLPIAVFPTPHTDRAGTTRLNGSIPKFVWLGGIRREKDFGSFAEAVALLEPELRKNCFSFVIQSNLDDPYDRDTKTAREKLKAARLPNVELIERPLSGKEYTELLFGSSAVIIPRLTQFYRSRTSGIFVEALAAGKPVAVADNTWMSDELQRHGAGVTFEERDPLSLGKAVRKLASELKDMTAKAEASSKEWIAIHNPHRLYEMLQSAGRGRLKGLKDE